jgi:diguanylate cyclase (GGDEF)-like protein
LLFVLCGLFTLVTVLLPRPPGFHSAAVVLIALIAVGAGVVLHMLPWTRIPDIVRLAIAPAAMGLIALHNVAVGMDAYRYTMFFFVVFMWLGLCEPRGTSFRMSPFVLVAYMGPLLMRGASDSDLSSISYAVPFYIAAGEVLAWRTARLRRLQERLRQLAEHDALTGLPNRAKFASDLRDAGPEPTSVLFLDLDGFKQINDRLGHAAGDQVLVDVAGVLTAACRPGSNDLPCRLAGDEFVVLLPGADVTEGRKHAELLRDRLAALRTPDGAPVRCSVGVAGGSVGGSHDLIAEADKAMYRAKQSRSGVATVSLSG